MTDETKAALKALELYSARHPRPPHVNQKQAADMLGVSARTVHNMIKAGTLRLNRCGLIPIEQIDAVLQPA
ncbi:helix-turn-helix domain-containing protein [Burkholderia multivorans]|uniref:helix-turn-helix domain-containing protein n=1 Tax=Burkholderia multivorans TaxID=87883 RepID=UPI00201A0FC5|nr:helix-turn-helix domain-containing protein [Burkholderia multivorans]MCO1371495.1 helix-turn-helix domain-containing protein [Burkholderia multivorans]MCO1457257.1 helix-turn-helix domain-containing protein [Burkholderia multivorans]MCO1466243.1 helix-turn-helix domain-containing protein [Burkholderia multivorans]UQO16062.1 helix-turn-helix domain-containing protein [Burkholderia multivorans]UQO86571.1 helix-turn-helix domain-containing protein [Burkholderia multivorans]